MDRVKPLLRSWLNKTNPIQEKNVRDLAKISHLSADYDRVYHVHVRKTGGTSLNYGFFAVDGVDPKEVYRKLDKRLLHRVIINGKVFVGWNRELINRGDYFFAFSHIPIYELRLPPRTFTVTCLRDPVQRVLSLYNMLVEFEIMDVDHPLRRTECKWLGRSFSDFMENIPQQHLLNQLHMYSPAFDIDEAAGRIEDCSLYFFTEAFSEGIGAINERLGLALTPLTARKTNRENIAVTADEIARLREALEPEYRLLERLQRSSAS